MKKIITYFAAIVLLFSACKKEIDETNITETIEQGTTTESITFLVQDIDKKPIANANVLIDGKTFQSDANGNVGIKDLVVTKDGLAASAQKTGYFTGYQRVIQGKNDVKITLAKKKTCISFPNSNGYDKSIVNTFDNIKILPNAFEKNDGTPYTGNVNLCYERVKRDTVFYDALVSPDYLVSLATGKPYRTWTFGAIMIETLGDNGEVLRLKQGQKISLLMIILSPFYDLYPNEVTALYLDTATNTWKEEGKMIKTNSAQYQLNITRTNTLWTGKEGVDLVVLDGKVVDKDNVPVEGLDFTFVNNSSQKKSYAHSNKDGLFRGYGIAGENITVKVFVSPKDGSLAKLVKTFSIAAKTQNTNIGNIVIDSLTIIKGKVVDCVGNNVTSGFVNFKETLTKIPLNSDGTFRYYADFDKILGNQITITPVGNGIVGNAQVLNFNYDKINDLGAISPCVTTNQKSYILINYNNKDYFVDENAKFETTATSNRIVAEKLDNNGYKLCVIQLKKPTTLNQNVPLKQIIMMGQDQGAGSIETWIDCSNCLGATITLDTATEIKGTISGTDKDGKAVTGSFYFKK